MTSPSREESPLQATGHNDLCEISRSALLHVLQGVIVATNTSDDRANSIVEWISSCRVSSLASVQDVPHADGGRRDAPLTATFLFNDWRAAINFDFHSEKDEDSRQLVNLALAIAFLRQRSRSSTNGAISSTDLSRIWGLIHSALASPRLSRPLCSTKRSAQGFLAVPLCSLLKDGNIDELFRLHVWLPDRQEGNPDFAIHSHQSFARSWILAGEGRDHVYEVIPAGEDSGVDATHAEYALAWSGGEESHEKKYVTHQTSSVVVNTGRLVHATSMDSAIHTRDMAYSIPEAAFHRTEVAPDSLHATIFFFDSHTGFAQNAYVLGPKETESYTHFRDPDAVTPATLARIVDAVRKWEVFMGQGQQYAQRAEWEHALQAFNSARNLCESLEYFPNATRYRQFVLGQLGNTNRRFGRNEQAKDFLEQVLAEMGPSLQRVELSGELGVVYRHMSRLADAKGAFELQYNTARQLAFERGMCRAVGNLGMVNYQLSQENHDHGLLDLAIEQLLERVQISRHIKETIDNQVIDPKTKSHWLRDATTWESIGLSRLSLCYSASGKTKEAVAAALSSFNLSSTSEDPTVVAMSHFFYGRALLLDGQRTEALRYFNPPRTACTPAIALCKEPSDEHRQYLRDLIAAGTDMDLVDEQGYTALDYAVFSADKATQDIVLDGLRHTLEDGADGDVETKLALRLAEAKIRKGYREVFQERLRPVLFQGGSSSRNDTGAGKGGLQLIRRAYADALAADGELWRMFDELKCVRYSEFLRFGRLPRSTDGLTRRLIAGEGGPRRGLQDKRSEGEECGTVEEVEEPTDFVIFISYRWINKDKGVSSPDDGDNTQYGRIVDAVEEFLKKRPTVKREGVGLWLDHACINQDDPTPGVTALPMLLAQCDAVISLVDDRYYDRAWCSVEVMMVQTLKRSYGLHSWVVQVEDADSTNTAQVEGLGEYEMMESGEKRKNNKKKWILHDGPMDLEIDMVRKQLTFEEDRPKVLFLERQTKLLA